MLKQNKRKYNVRKAIFTLHKYDGNKVEVEIVGRLIKKKFLFWTWWDAQIVNPEKVIEKWGRVRFIKINPREFVSINDFRRITYRTKDFVIEK